mmetsp:Transcript_94434/g.281872  ORF Transcript_94434/g.281872 Transcript_94434/m.281872 type:complete len:346 (-) Transcript_94434:955-1992(-)
MLPSEVRGLSLGRLHAQKVCQGDFTSASFTREGLDARLLHLLGDPLHQADIHEAARCAGQDEVEGVAPNSLAALEVLAEQVARVQADGPARVGGVRLDPPEHVVVVLEVQANLPRLIDGDLLQTQRILVADNERRALPGIGVACHLAARPVAGEGRVADRLERAGQRDLAPLSLHPRPPSPAGNSHLPVVGLLGKTREAELPGQLVHLRRAEEERLLCWGQASDGCRLRAPGRGMHGLVRVGLVLLLLQEPPQRRRLRAGLQVGAATPRSTRLRLPAVRRCRRRLSAQPPQSRRGAPPADRVAARQREALLCNSVVPAAFRRAGFRRSPLHRRLRRAPVAAQRWP